MKLFVCVLVIILYFITNASGNTNEANTISRLRQRRSCTPVIILRNKNGRFRPMCKAMYNRRQINMSALNETQLNDTLDLIRNHPRFLAGGSSQESFCLPFCIEIKINGKFEYIKKCNFRGLWSYKLVHCYVCRKLPGLYECGTTSFEGFIPG